MGETRAAKMRSRWRVRAAWLMQRASKHGDRGGVFVALLCLGCCVSGALWRHGVRTHAASAPRPQPDLGGYARDLYGHRSVHALKPTSNKQFECSVCRIERPCVSKTRHVYFAHALDVASALAGSQPRCEFQLDKSGEYYVQAQHSSKRWYVRDVRQLPARVRRTYVRADVMNLASYSPHIPFFLWTVYVRALFLKRACGWHVLKALCDVDDAVYLVPRRHRGIRWIEGTLSILMRRVSGVTVVDDPRERVSDQEEQEEGNGASGVVCYRSAIFTDCLKDRVPRPGEYFVMGDIERREREDVKVLRTKEACKQHVSVLMIGRRKTRRLLKWQSLKQEVSQQLSGANVCHRIRMEYFEDVSFEQQTELMRQAHIVIGSHGAALGHMVFTRAQTLVIDIFPFGYNFRAFRSYAPWTNATYALCTARADVRTMRQCLRRKRRLFNAWAALRTVRDARLLEQASANVSSIHAVRRCVRAQRLTARAPLVRRALALWLAAAPPPPAA